MMMFSHHIDRSHTFRVEKAYQHAVMAVLRCNGFVGVHELHRSMLVPERAAYSENGSH